MVRCDRGRAAVNVPLVTGRQIFGSEPRIRGRFDDWVAKVTDPRRASLPAHRSLHKAR
jgi:hypothetical protein